MLTKCYDKMTVEKQKQFHEVASDYLKGLDSN